MVQELSMIRTRSVSVNWEGVLARRMATQYSDELCEQSEEQAAARLSVLLLAEKEKERRNEQQPSGWPERAQRMAPSLLEKAMTLTERRQRHAKFFQKEYDKALAIAKSKLPTEEAEEAVSEALIRLSAGKTTTVYFYRTLQQTICDRLRKLQVLVELRDRVVKASRNRFLPTDAEDMGGARPFSWQVPILGQTDQDPLEILVRREAIADGMREVLTESKYRSVTQRQWWDELRKCHSNRKSCTESARSNA